MHRTNSVAKLTFGSVLLGLALGGTATAQKKELLPPPAPAATAAERGAIVVPINGTQRLQMTTKKKIKTVVNEREMIARVSPLAGGEPTWVLITGLEPGTTRVTLTDVDGHAETVEVIVQFDVEYLRAILRRAVPSANIEPIPAASNTILLTGTVANAEDIDIIMRAAQSVVGRPEMVVNGMRVGGVMQVQLDVVVALVDRSKARQFGYNLLGSSSSTVFGSTIGGLGGPITSAGTISPTALGASGGTGGSGGSQSGTTLITGGAVSTVPNPANLFLGVVTSSGSFFNLLQALKTESLVKIQAEPRVVTLSGHRATFNSGGQQAVPVVAGLGGTAGVEFVPFGTQLDFLPVVLGNGKIHLEVTPNITELDNASGVTIPGGGFVPGRSQQTVNTCVEIEDGQTFVIGGLIQRLVQGTAQKVPILGELPYVGAAFSVKSYTERELETVIVVTPHLVDPMSCDQVQKVLPGYETRSPDDFELFLEGILEAPRGPREVCPDGRYRPAFKNGPTASLIPCGDYAGNGNGQGCNGPGCAGAGAIHAPLTQVAPPEGAGSQPASSDPAKSTVGGTGPAVSPDPGSQSSDKPSALPQGLGSAAGSDGQR
jgi:pilus assembly protein CpaC